MAEETTKFDVAVIGAGPAGIMAAGRAAELGAKVVLIDKNMRIGRKLLLTGNGRCNLTNAEFDLRSLAESYGKNGKFLFQAFSFFPPKEVIAFFNKLGLQTKTEKGNRVFPESDSAEDVLRALEKYLIKNKVTFIFDNEVIEIAGKKKITKLILKDRQVSAKNYIFCTGGKSFAITGSTGDGYKWAKDLGHTIDELTPALVPIKVKEDWVKDLQALALENVGVSVYLDGKKKFTKVGDLLFTHFGLSGPVILNMSGEVGKLLKEGEVEISIDFKPLLNEEELGNLLQDRFFRSPKKTIKNFLADGIPAKVSPLLLNMIGMDPEKQVSNITKKERILLAKAIKSFFFIVDGLLDFDQAMVTSGGISLNEIDTKTMKSKIVSNLYFAGELVSAAGATGGFNLQMCWSTGRLAGESAAKK